MSFKSQFVEFIGGPFDGHHLTLDASERKLIPLATFAVSKNVVRLLSGHSPGPVAPITSIAVYQLERTGEYALYRFLHAEPVAKSEVGTRKSESQG